MRAPLENGIGVALTSTTQIIFGWFQLIFCCLSDILQASHVSQFASLPLDVIDGMDPSRGLRTHSYAPRSNHARDSWRYTSLDGKTFVELKQEYAAMLQPGALMTENLFNFYLLWLQRQMPPQQLSSVFILSSGFITAMRNNFPANFVADWLEERMAKYRRWLPPDFFSKNLIFVPIYARVHFTLAIVCFPLLAFTSSSQPAARRPFILLLDSLDPYGAPDLKTAIFLLRNLISDVYKAQRHQRILLTDDNMPVQRIPVLRQQDNDCGFCVLHFIEVIVRHAWGENFCNFNASAVQILLSAMEPPDMRANVRRAFDSVARYDQVDQGQHQHPPQHQVDRPAIPPLPPPPLPSPSPAEEAAANSTKHRLKSNERKGRSKKPSPRPAAAPPEPSSPPPPPQSPRPAAAPGKLKRRAKRKPETSPPGERNWRSKRP